MIRVEVLGANVVSAELLALAGAAQVAADEGAKVAGEDVAEGAKARVPVETGTLRDSLHAEDGPDGETLVGTDIDYAPFVEFGTAIMAAQPYLRPALDAEGEHAVEAVDRALAAVIAAL